MDNVMELNFKIMFLRKLDNAGLNMMIDYYYEKIMDNQITLEERALYNELYEALTYEKNYRLYE